MEVFHLRLDMVGKWLVAKYVVKDGNMAQVAVTTNVDFCCVD